MLVDHNEVHLLAEPRTETDLGEVCAPVGWQFSLSSPVFPPTRLKSTLLLHNWEL